MTLLRTGLRLAAVEALRNATLAGPRVFDSRLDALDGLAPDQATPILIVSTEKDFGTALSDQNGGPPFRRSITMQVECAALAIDRAEPFAIGYPETDAEIEATLDALEHQVIETLAYGESAAAKAFRRFALRQLKVESDRWTDGESGARLAARVLAIEVELCFDPTPLAAGGLPPPFDALAAAAPAGGATAATLATLATLAPAPVTTPFTGADLTVHPLAEIGPTAPPRGEPNGSLELAARADPPQ